MNKRIFLIIIVIASFAAGCSKKANISKFSKKNKLEVQNLDFEYLNSRAKVRYDDGSKRVNLNANIRVKKDSIIWVSLSPVFGIEVARGIITPDSLVLVNRIDQEYEVHNYTSLSKRFNFNIDFELIQSMLLGNMPEGIATEDKLRKQKDQLLIKQLIGHYSIENYISAETMKLKKVFIEEVPTHNTLHFEYDNFNVVEKNVFPFSSNILLSYNTETSKSYTKIDIDHSRVNLQKENLSFPFDIPEKYDRR